MVLDKSESALCEMITDVSTGTRVEEEAIASVFSFLESFFPLPFMRSVVHPSLNIPFRGGGGYTKLLRRLLFTTPVCGNCAVVGEH